MVAWNASPLLLGMQWSPDAASVVPITDTDTALQQIAATTAETITKLSVGHGNPVGNGDLICDICPAGSEVPGGATDFVAVPSADISRAVYTDWSNATTNLYAMVANPATEDRNSVFPISGGAAWPYYCKFNTDTAVGGAHVTFRLNTAAFPTAQRVTNVRLAVIDTTYNGTGGVHYSFEVISGGAQSGHWTPGYGDIPEFVDYGEICPWTGLPWSQADVVNLSNGTVGLRCSNAITNHYAASINSVLLRITSVPENRVAFGTGPYTTGSTSTSLTVNHPTAGGPPVANWAKPNTGMYSYILRRARSINVHSGALSWASLRSTVGVLTPPDLNSAPVTLDAAGQPALVGAATPAAGYSLTQFTAPTTPSVDSQPYEALVIATLSATTRQTVTGPAGGATFVSCRLFIQAPNDVSYMAVTVRRASDNVAMSSTEPITSATAAANGVVYGTWQSVQVDFVTPAVLAAGVAYYIDLVASSTTWRVLGLRSSPANAAATFLGTGTLDANTYSGGADLVAVLAVLIAPLASLTVTQQNLSLGPPSDPCLPPRGHVKAFGYVHLVWPASSLGSGFVQYEVQRWDTAGETWEPVATLADQTETIVEDFEARLGILSAYRVRMVVDGGLASTWLGTPAGPATITLLTAPEALGDGALLFSTNQEPELSVAYPEVYGANTPVRVFDLLEAPEAAFRSIYGRDYQVAFRPTERRGVKFTRQLLLNALISTKVAPYDLWAPALDLSLVDAPYVCVRDRTGRRWYTAMQLTQATEGGPDGHSIVFADATFTELSGPAAVTVPNSTLGWPWEALDGTWGSDGAQGMLVAPPTDGSSAVVVVDAHSADVTVAVFLARDTTSQMGLALRVIDNLNYIAVLINPTGGAAGLSVVTVINGSAVVVATTAGSGATWHTYTATISGSGGAATISVFDNGVLKLGPITITNPMYDGWTGHGLVNLGNPGSSGRWDTFTLTRSDGTVVVTESFVR